MIEYEIITHERIRHIHILANEISFRSFHLHADMELIYVLQGNGTISSKENNITVNSGSMVLFNAFEAHEIRAGSETLHVLIFQISNHFLREYFPQIRYTIFTLHCVHECLKQEDFQKMEQLMKTIALDYFRKENFYELKVVQNSAELLQLLLKNVPYETLNDSEYNRRKKNNQRMNLILSAIEANYTSNIHLKDLSQQQHVSVTHFSHLFRECFGISFQQYLNHIRLEHALHLLSNSSLTLTEIAASSGFSELKYMNQAFISTFHISCKDFRKQNVAPQKNKGYATEHILSDDETVQLLEKQN